VDLTGDDVQDILQLLDSLPFGEMHLRTARFSLWLRRDADGEWTQELQILSEPVVAVAAARSGEIAAAETPAGGERGTAVDAPAAGEKGTAAETPAGGERGTAVDAPPAGEKGTAADTDGERGTAGAAGGAAPAVPPPSGAEPDGLLRAVRAPLPGTFYRAPMPGAPPFVEVGSRVEPDTVVGIVETMKLMNSVSAGARGTVEQIPLANAQFAERDAVLMWIREDA
jgi:acetyl-CoA carboxylase biotin carboxyl carrier protein